MEDDDLLDLYDEAPCGYLSLAAAGKVVRANRTLLRWIGAATPDAIVGQSVHAILSFGGRIAFETHLAPLLRLKGSVDEIAFDLMHADGTKVPVIANACEKRAADGTHRFTRITLFKAVERRRYERDLVEARSEADARADAEHEASLLREQFIAVLGHDLRNPLAALQAGVDMIAARETLSDRGQFVIREMGASISRATALINDVLDLARGRLAGGVSVARDAKAPLAPVLEHVLEEIRAIWPDRTFVAAISIDRPVECDRGRIAQLASNLIANAVTHGAPDKAITVKAQVDGDRLVFSVANGGEPIAEAVKAQLFQPFFRGHARQSQQGLGLGLFIVNEIAKAHGGSMDVSSTAEETRFTFSMPVVSST